MLYDFDSGVNFCRENLQEISFFFLRELFFADREKGPRKNRKN